MSIFKVKQWWSNAENTAGIQNVHCLKVDRFSSHSDSDCILVGEGTFIKMYKPNTDTDIAPTILESELEDFVLQIDTGKFVSGHDDRQIIVLHPRSYSIYQLKRKEGHTEAGDFPQLNLLHLSTVSVRSFLRESQPSSSTNQRFLKSAFNHTKSKSLYGASRLTVSSASIRDQNQLIPLIKHSFSRRAASVTCGSFGNIKTRDFICIQGLDGSLSFFDQDTFLFISIFNDIIIPGPVYYIQNSDSFVICKSTWILEIYSYQQLREYSDLTIRQNKMNIPQWTYNAGEEVTQIQVIQTSSNFSSIISLGERHLYCFQDNGLMKYVIKFEYMPMCFNAYLIGWYYEPTARLLIMVASEDSKLFIYERTTLLWSCDLISTTISISRCFLKSLSGGIVTLSHNGIINICYLGTEPDLNGNVTPMVNEVADPEVVQSDLEEVEEALQKIMGNQEDSNWSNIDQILKIKADVGKPVENMPPDSMIEGDETIHLLKCPVIVILTCDDPKQIRSVQITYVVLQPFECSESTICLDSVNGTEIVETQAFLSNDYDISDTSVKIIFTVTDSVGKIIVLETKVLLPLTLYCSLIELSRDNKLKICIEGNQPSLEFDKIFADFTEEDLTKHENSNEFIRFQYRSSKRTILIKRSTNQYIIEAEEFSDFPAILEHFLYRLNDHYTRMGIKDFRFRLKYDKDMIKQIIVKFLRSIEAHAKERLKLNTFEDELNTLQKQFLTIQKRLLVQYGSLPPGNCDPLEFLMKDTHKRLIECVTEIIQCKQNVCRAGNTVIAVGRLITGLLKRITKDDFKIKLIEEILTLTSLYEHYQEWEESVAQGLTYILNKVFHKSSKDKEKLAPVQDQAVLSQINLKRFIKQLRTVIDKLFNETETDELKDTQITRIEELVEVL